MTAEDHFEPVLIDPTKAICLLAMQVPDPDDDENTYPGHLLILSLKVLEKLIVTVAITEEDTACTSQACTLHAKTWLQNP